eukprot:TRINITY_DN1925_c0_g1_i6.p1 TRINITY_DN1925_c0_g1~~TRINITY_DN1925_c0_g1_i6.p1  ORF type:complete len:312 (-),score=-15.83 TRINITY_DN1925_c0_g1_i6:1106-2041(-)
MYQNWEVKRKVKFKFNFTPFNPSKFLHAQHNANIFIHFCVFEEKIINLSVKSLSQYQYSPQKRSFNHHFLVYECYYSMHLLKKYELLNSKRKKLSTTLGKLFYRTLFDCLLGMQTLLRQLLKKINIQSLQQPPYLTVQVLMYYVVFSLMQCVNNFQSIFEYPHFDTKIKSRDGRIGSKKKTPHFQYNFLFRKSLSTQNNIRINLANIQLLVDIKICINMSIIRKFQILYTFESKIGSLKLYVHAYKFHIVRRARDTKKQYFMEFFYQLIQIKQIMPGFMYIAVKISKITYLQILTSTNIYIHHDKNLFVMN